MVGKREQSRERIDAEIMATARVQLAEVGAASLSLRSIAREVGMVSSAVYRYVESRDELLTRLIVDAYDSLGVAAEQAAAAHRGDGDLERWVATAASIRGWALEHPHEYLLLYGSPVPGYAAPTDTVVPGTRVTFALIGILRDAAANGRLADAGDETTALAGGPPDGLVDDLGRLAEQVSVTPTSPESMVAFVAAWTQLFGLIGFELTNQTRGVVDHHAELFEATTRLTGRWIGLR